MGTAFVVFPSKTHDPDLTVKKIQDKYKVKEYGISEGESPQLSRSSERKEVWRNHYRSKESKETWWLNVIWFSAWFSGTEKRH